MKTNKQKGFVFIAIFAILFLVPQPKITASEANSDYLIKLDNEDTVILNTTLEDLGTPDTLKSKEIYRWKRVKNISSQEFEALKNNPHVIDIHKEINLSLDVAPDDPKYLSFGNIFSGQYDQWDMRKIGLLPVQTPTSNTSGWEISTGSADTVVAVIDTGIDFTHPDLQANVWVNSAEQGGIPCTSVYPPSPSNCDDDNNGYGDDINGWNFVTDTANVADQLGHGTHVAGTIGAVSNNGIGISGVCWNCKIMPLKIFGAVNSVGENLIAEAINYAVDNGANVINLSITGQGYSQLIQDAVDYAWSHNVVVVAAAGNDNGADTSTYIPAGLNHVIAVSATDYDDTIAGFSNVGQKVDVSAPGVFTLSTKFRALGSGGCLGETDYYCLSGTSMATPHVSGVAALIYDLHKDDITPWDNIKIRYDILKNLDDKGAAGFDNSFGYGRLNALTALQDNSITLDPSVPTVDLDAPANNYFSHRVTLSGSVQTNDIYMYRLLFNLNGTLSIYNFTGRGNKSNEQLVNQDMSLYEGSYQVILSAEDFNGSVTDSTPITILIDTTPPNTFNISSPTNSWTTQQTQTFGWQATSDSSAQPVTYNLYVDSTLKASGISATSYLLNEALSEGTHDWYVASLDKAGNSRSSNTINQVRIDLSAPADFAPSVNVINSVASVSFSTTDSLSGISHYEYSIDNGSFSTTTSPYTTPSLPDGSHNIRIKAVDNVGNEKIVQSNFTINSVYYIREAAGDFNHNAVVDLSDLSILATYWNQNSSSGDANHDGKVDLSDLSILAQNWGKNI